MTIWRIPLTVELAEERSQNTMVSHLGITWEEIGPDYVVARMPIDDRTRQPIGIMHGGATCVLAETAGSLAANCCVDLDKQYCVGLSIQSNHIRSIRDGSVLATAKPKHLGRSTQVWEIAIESDAKLLISSTILTMMVLNR